MPQRRQTQRDRPILDNSNRAGRTLNPMLRSDKFGSAARGVNRRDLLGGAISAGVLAGGTPGWLRAAGEQPPNGPVIGYLDAVRGRIGRGIGRGLAEKGFVGGEDAQF